MASSSQPAHGFIMFHPLTLWCHHCRGGTYPRTRQGSGSIAGKIIEVHAWKLSSATFDCRRLVVIKKSPQAIFSETCAPTRYSNSPMSVLTSCFSRFLWSTSLRKNKKTWVCLRIGDTQKDVAVTTAIIISRI